MILLNSVLDVEESTDSRRRPIRARRSALLVNDALDNGEPVARLFDVPTAVVVGFIVEGIRLSAEREASTKGPSLPGAFPVIALALDAAPCFRPSGANAGPQSIAGGRLLGRVGRTR